ncbi:hypothetical protein ACV34F_30105, partial [Pseudomonas aeruginosa]
PETQLSNFIQFRLASDRLFAGQIDPLPWFSLRYHTLERRSQLLQSSLWGLGGAMRSATSRAMCNWWAIGWARAPP